MLCLDFGRTTNITKVVKLNKSAYFDANISIKMEINAIKFVGVYVNANMNNNRVNLNFSYNDTHIVKFIKYTDTVI